MRSYLIDEIMSPDIEKISDFLKENAIASNLNQLFWVEIPMDLLNETQFQHNDCRPYVFAVEVGQDWVKLEFFIRSLNKMQCTCPAYCTDQQRNFVVKFGHSMLDQLNIGT